jgi:hypothetical protein
MGLYHYGNAHQGSLARNWGEKHNGLHMKTSALLEDCIMFHKLTMFTCDAAERQKHYMYSGLRKPHKKMSICQQVGRVESLNGYIPFMPTLNASALAVTSAEKGDIPFNKATLAAIIMGTCPNPWRNQYELNHKTVPESPRAMLNAHGPREH